MLWLGPHADPWVGAALVPAVGMAVLTLGGLVAAEVGVPLGGNGGAATYAVTTLAGISGLAGDLRGPRDRAGRYAVYLVGRRVVEATATGPAGTLDGHLPEVDTSLASIRDAP